jgi:uncharacterized membrane protein YvbJ
MFCTTCGKQIADGSDACPWCGNKVKIVPSTDTIVRKAEDRKEAWRTVRTLVIIVAIFLGLVISYQAFLAKSVQSRMERDNSKEPAAVSIEKDSRKCKSCNRVFTDSDNTWSIALRGMCENCYKNFKWSQEVKDFIKNNK